MYGYVTAAHALSFSKDLKLAHYTKIPPKHTFICQIVATFISAFVVTSLFNFLLGFKNICTNDATFSMTCPGTNTFFTASVFWGTYGPLKLFGPNGHYKTPLIGFPVGFALPFITFFINKKFKGKKIRALHPVAMTYGALSWAPYNMSHQLPGVVMTYISWAIIKPRFLAFWARYNYILYSAWMTGVAIAAIVIFFALQIPEVSVDWWGNKVPYAVSVLSSGAVHPELTSRAATTRAVSACRSPRLDTLAPRPGPSSKRPEVRRTTSGRAPLYACELVRLSRLSNRC